MIVYRSGFVLTSLGDVPLTHSRIGYQSWIRDRAASDVAASSESASGPRDAPLRPDTAEYWEPTSLPATWRVDLGTSRDVDYVGIAGHTISSAGCAVTVETSTDATNWTTFAQGIAPANDAPLLFLDDAVVARHVRLSLTGGLVVPKIAVVYAGLALAMERPVQGRHTPITLSRETVLSKRLSRGGQFLGQGFRRLGVVGDAAYKNLSAAWYRANFEPFVKHARNLPFFFAWNPAEHSDEVAYVWAEDDIAPAYEGTNPLFSVALKMRGIGNN
jgi:hypothetical protein